MIPVIPWSANNFLLVPGTTITIEKNNHHTICSLSRKTTKQILPSQRHVFPLSASVKLFSQYRRDCVLLHKSLAHIVSATGTDVVVEESDSPTVSEDSGIASEVAEDAAGTSKKFSAKSDTNPGPAQSRRSRPNRKSEMPPIKNEDLVPGATFTGKVRSIQPFGAFIDFGAFTDGLVHVSRLSDSFIKDVGSVVSVGQEVQVRIVEANMETGRISLSMRESDDTSRLQQQKDASATASSDKPRQARRNTSKASQKRDFKTSKFVKGQDLEGTVKNMTRAGAFISLPEGEEGFLPIAEEPDDGFGNMLGGSSLEIGQEVSVRVLRITRGQVTLTMKKEEENEKLDVQITQGVIHTATNPFVLAFRQNKEIATFLDQREDLQKAVKEPEKSKVAVEVKGQEKHTEAGSDIPAVDSLTSSDEDAVNIVPKVDEAVEGVETSFENVSLGEEITNDDKSPESTESSMPQNIDDPVLAAEKEEGSSPILNPEVTVLSADEEVSLPKDLESEGKPDFSGEISSQDFSSESPVPKEDPKIQDEDVEKGEVLAPTEETEIFSAEAVKDGGVGAVPADNGIITSSESQAVEGVEDQVENAKEEEQIPSETEVLYASEVEDKKVEPTIEKNDIDSNLSGQSARSSPEESRTKESQAFGEVENQVEKAKDEEHIPFETEVLSASEVEDKKVEPSVEKNDSDGNLSGQSARSSPKESRTKEGQAVEEVENTVENAKGEVQIPSETELSSDREVEDKKVESTVPNNEMDGNSNGQNASSSSVERKTKATISPALVKQLREETGAGMMDCKKALSETGGDLVKAQEFLRKKGLASAEKKASRATAEGRIGSYIHDSRIGVLVEVNCETDFVSRGDIFKELVDDLAMQVVACPQVQYLVTEDVPEEIVNKEREIEMQKEDLLSRPEQIRSKIVEGRIKKRLEELALLEQPYIKNDKVVVKDWVKQTIATIGENIKVKRFVRYNLGEGLEKKSQDFAAEVAAQTAAKPVTTPTKEQSAVSETKEIPKLPAATISAALVKQLREETGAGMMDCKKALSETGGDLEKAQEYLRKKGLSTADKKSSRLAAEGRIGSYIHDSRIGVLIEVNSETDFVGRSEKFKELVDDLAMQVVACPQVQYVSVEDIPEDIVDKEKELEMQREDILSKPENIRGKIVEGRVSKRLGELALLEQPFIKDDSVLVKDLVKQTVAALGENIKVRRFVRFTLGEATEDAKA
ncbi:hypothetical protein K2173_015992 [Erythroxylum novogranatense]|uniref:Elongation factor Ts, mitochondrial n=1 Tax=Erythroxylum novogranatense TaxID=1862640 RepID=A0AAV8SFN0_9ROSI|nr:hypothetical protein K2173_015992 [Erythroxylum novogranatense]